MEDFNNMKDEKDKISLVYISPIVEHEKFFFFKKKIIELSEDVTYFDFPNFFMDIYSKKHKKNLASIFFNSSFLDIGDINYVDDSKKSIEVFKKEYLIIAKQIIKKYRQKYKENVNLIDST